MPHLASLLRVARRLTLELASAEDLVQETMLLAWRGFRTFEPGTNARAWLFRILFNAFYGESRRALREEEALRPVEAFVRPTFQNGVEMSEALNTLSLDHRTILLLAVVEGFTSREIAGILDVPVGTVMSRLSRAREELRKSLAPLARQSLAKEAYK